MQSTIYSKWFIAIMIVTSSTATTTSSQEEQEQLQHAIDGCEFPAFMQTKTMSRDWRRVVLAQNTESTGSVMVDRMLLRSTAIGSTIDNRYRYVQTCLKLVKVDDAELYLVSHDTDFEQLSASDDPDKPSSDDELGGVGPSGGANGFAQRRYTCVQFIRRSPDVVQTRSAALRGSLDESSCDFRALGDPDPSLFVDVAVLAKPPLPLPSREGDQFRQSACSLRGGFRLRISGGGRRRRSSCSDVAASDARLESSCNDEDDASVFFNFGSVECVPEGLYMYAEQRVICIATWTSGTNTFSVLRHDRLSYAWLLRHPTEYDASFVAHLFVDLYADTSASIPPPSPTSNNFLLELVRDRPVPITSLCTDESDTCVTDEVDVARSLACRRSDGARQLMCARTCGICNATRPAVCQFPPEMVGVWIDGSSVNHPVSENTLSVFADRKSFAVRSASAATELRYYCIRFQPSDYATTSNSQRNRTGKGNHHVSDEFLVATSPTNGCRRRYACARFTMRSASIIYFRLSESRTWPLTSTPSSPIDCRWFSYDVTRRGTYGSESHDNHVQLFFARDKLRDLATTQAVLCRLPSEEFSNYSVSFVQDGAATVSDCVASLHSRLRDPTVDAENNVLLSLTECTRARRAASATVSFTCLDSMRLTSGDIVLVSIVVSTTTTNTFIDSTSSSQMSSSIARKLFSPSENSSSLPATNVSRSSFGFSKQLSPSDSASIFSPFLPNDSASTNSTSSNLVSQAVPLLTSLPELRRNSSSFSSAFVSSSFAFRRGSVFCWLFPHKSSANQFYVVSATQCTELFAVTRRRADQQQVQQRQSVDDSTKTTQTDDADYIRRRIFTSSSANGAIFSKTRGRSPRLEPPSGGLDTAIADRNMTPSVAEVETQSSDTVPSKRLPASRAAVALPEFEQRSIVLDDQRAMMSDDDSQQIDEIVWDDVEELTTRTRRIYSELSETSCAVSFQVMDVRIVLVAVSVAFVFELMGICSNCLL